jgi:hypothetical protein
VVQPVLLAWGVVAFLDICDGSAIAAGDSHSFGIPTFRSFIQHYLLTGLQVDGHEVPWDFPTCNIEVRIAAAHGIAKSPAIDAREIFSKVVDCG